MFAKCIQKGNQHTECIFLLLTKYAHVFFDTPEFKTRAINRTCVEERIWRGSSAPYCHLSGWRASRQMLLTPNLGAWARSISLLSFHFIILFPSFVIFIIKTTLITTPQLPKRLWIYIEVEI